MAGRDDEVERRLEALIPRLHRFAWLLTGARADADDVTQATLERALMRKRELAGDIRLEAWLMRVARNLWLDQLRRRRVREAPIDPELLGAIHAVSTGADPVQRIEAREAMAAFADLPPGQKEVAALVLAQGYTYQEAADALQTPIGTVMSRLARARRTLADRLLGPETRVPEGAA